MNPLNIINHMKVEKPNLIKLIISNQTLMNNPNIFRIFEIFLILAVTSRLLNEIQPPIELVLTLASESLHTLSLLLLSPPFIFIIGNAIVLTLFMKCPKYNVERPKSSSNDHRKKVAIGEETIMAVIFATSAEDHQAVTKFYRRSTSEVMVRRKALKVEGGGGLRRAKSNMEISKTSKGYCGKCGMGCRKSKVGHYPEDHMSKEEFRQTIEDFIAKQQRVLREEEMDLILLEDYE